MTQASSVEPARARSVGRRLIIAVTALCLIAAVILTTLWLNRRAATRQILVGWLERQGVPADVDIEAVELDRIVARVRVGDARNPDAIVERVEVDYAIGAPWSRAGLGVTPSRIRLVRPVVRATLDGGKLSFGSLDPVIERFTGRPPKPDSRGPLVLVEQGRLNLTSEYGVAAVLADARIDDGKLMRLSARMPAQSLKSDALAMNDLSVALDITTTGDRMALSGRAQADGLAAGGSRVDGAAVVFTGDLPYPDLERRRGDGRARFEVAATAKHATFGRSRVGDAAARVLFEGQTRGWLEAFRLDGSTDTALSVGSLIGPGLRARAATVTATKADAAVWRDDRGFGWRIEGPMTARASRVSGAGLVGDSVRMSTAGGLIGGRGGAFEAQGGVAVAADRLSWDQLRLDGVSGRTKLDVVSDGGVTLSANGALDARRGAWPLLGAPTRDDLPELAAMKQALQSFAVSVPAFAVAAEDGAARITLGRPATIRPSNGGVLTIRSTSIPIFSTTVGDRGGGSLALTSTRGSGLPEARFDIPSWRLTADGFTATLNGRAALDFGLARGLDLSTRGVLTSGRGGLSYATRDACTPLSVDRLELGENDVFDLSGSLCQTAGPLVSVRDNGWVVRGALRGVDARAPFLALQIDDASGALLAQGRPGGVDLAVDDVRADILDATTPRRFNPLTARGAATLRRDIWSGAFDLARNSVGLGRLTLEHNGVTGSGGIDIDAPSIVFAEKGLQPSDLSPLAGDIVGSPAVGAAGFVGRVDWAIGTEGASHGRLTIPGLDFVSPAGPVKGLKGAVDFISLAPLVTAPDQQLTADGLETFADLADLRLSFSLDKSALTVGGGETALGGGVVRIEPLILPLDRTQGFEGVLVLDNVQLGDVVASAGFGDKVKLDAVVSGRLPFTFDPKTGARVTGGTLAAVKPGRLSIAREALSGLEAGGGGDVPPNTIQDLAYQAMENLSFDLLSADVNSLDQGRLSVLFHIRGRHDPPARQELRVGIAELISREFLNRPLPLPSGTAIDLTLDTTLNVNQLVSDLLAINRARSGDPDGAPTKP